jgi:hypothetical protein
MQSFESSFALVKTQLEPVLSYLQALYDKHPRWIQIFAFSTFILGPPLRRNYNAYISLGPGGVPYNIVGWTISSLLTAIVGREMLSVDSYVKDPNHEMWLSPKTLPIRRGERPVMSWHAIPQRQMTQRCSDSAMHAVRPHSSYSFLGLTVLQKVGSLTRKYANANPQLVERITSPHERLHECLSIHPNLKNPHDVAKTAWREVLHVHDGSDWSMHATLAPKDCKLGVS